MALRIIESSEETWLLREGAKILNNKWLGQWAETAPQGSKCSTAWPGGIATELAHGLQKDVRDVWKWGLRSIEAWCSIQGARGKQTYCEEQAMNLLTRVLFKQTSIPLLKRSLDASSLRQNVISNNLANVSTPEYRRREVVFEEALRKAMNRDGVQGWRTHSRHIPIGRESVDRVQPQIVEVPEQTDFNGINNVDVDQEMAALAKNQILFSAAAKLAAHDFKELRKAIFGRAF